MTESGVILSIISMLIGASLLVVGLVTGYYRGLKRATREQGLDALADVGQAILSAQLNLDALCEIVYQQSTRVIDTRNFQLGIFDGNDYIIKVWLKDAERLAPEVFKGGAKEGLVGWVHEHGTGLLINDFQKEWDMLPAKPRYYDENNPARSAIFAPLAGGGGEVIGVIAAQSQSPRAFSQEDMRRLTVLAGQAAGAIRNAQLYEEANTQATRLRLIFKVSRQITAIQPLPDLFQQIVNLIQQTFGYYAVNIFILDPITNELVLGATSASNPTFRNIRLKKGQGIVGWTAENAKTTYVRDVSQDKRYIRTAALEATRSEMAVPLIFEHEIYGVLDIQSNRLDAFDKDDIFTMNSLAGQLALAIQESVTYQQEHKQSERLNALIEAARAVVSILDTSSLLEEVVELIDDYFGYDRVHLFTVDENRAVFRAGSGAHTKTWQSQQFSYPLTQNGFIPWVARHGRPLVSGNVHEDQRYFTEQGLEDTLSEMTVPIQMGAHTLGVLDIQSDKRDAFSPEDVTLVQALADTIAIALRNARLFANEMRRRILSETLREVSTVLASSLDLESVLKEILRGLERVVNYTAAMILLLDEDNHYFTVSAVHGVTDEDEVWGRVFPATDELQQLIDSTLERITHNDQALTEASPLTVPLTISDQCIGYLAIRRVGSYPFTTEETEIITTFANQAGVAIMNAQLYMAQKEEAWVSTALLEVAGATGQATTPDDVLRTVAHITPLLAGVEWCAVFLRDEDQFNLAELSGVRDELTEKLGNFSIKLEQWPPLQELLRVGHPIILSGDTPQPESFDIPINLLQAVLLPFFSGGEVFGMMVIGQREGEPPLTARKIELASGIANQAAVAIDRAQLYTAQQEEQWITTVILQVAEAVNSQFDVQSTLEAIVRYTTLLVGVTRCGILQWDSEQSYFCASKSSGLSHEGELAFATMQFKPDSHPFFQHLVDEPTAITCGLSSQHPLPDKLAQTFQVDAVLGIPLLAQGTLVGAMLVDHIKLEGASDQRRLKILTGIADQCALAIQTARLQEEALAVRSFEREMELARTIQLSLLPENPPTIENWEIAAYYRPARLVGGDFYDFIDLLDGKMAFVIADVADKGVPAAMFMTICRTIIRASASSTRSPLETLERVNRLIVQDNRTELFFTCWYGILDPQTGTLAFCSGGHNPPLLLRSDGQFQELRIKGMALGIMEPIKLLEGSVQLSVGDTLLCYTDGLTEARREDMTEFGEADLYINAMKYRKLSANALVQKIVMAVDRFTEGQPAFDDLTLFTLKRL